MSVTGPGGGQPTYRTEDGETIKFGDNAARGERGGTIADTIGYSEGLEMAMAILNSDFPQLYPPEDPRAQYNTQYNNYDNLFGGGNPFDLETFEAMAGAMTPEAFYFVQMAKYFKETPMLRQDVDLGDDVLFYFFHPELLEEQLAENQGSPLYGKLQRIKRHLNEGHKHVIGIMQGEGYQSKGKDRRGLYDKAIDKNWKPERKTEEFTKVFERSRAKMFGGMIEGDRSLTPQQKITLQNIYWGFESIDDHPELAAKYNDILDNIEAALRVQFSIPNDFPIPDIDNSEYQAAMQSNFDMHFEELLRANMSDKSMNVGMGDKGWKGFQDGIPKELIGLAINLYYNPNMDLASVLDEMNQYHTYGWGRSWIMNPEDLRKLVQDLLTMFTANFKSQYGLPANWQPTPRADTYNKTIETTRLYLIYQYMNIHPQELNEQGRLPITGNSMYELSVPRSVKAEVKMYLDKISQGTPWTLSEAGRRYLNTLQKVVEKELFILTGANVSDLERIEYINPQGPAEFTMRMFMMADSQLAALNTLASQLAPSQNKAILLQVLSMIDQMLQRMKMLLFYIMNEDSMTAKETLTGILESQLAIVKKQLATFDLIAEIEEEIDEKSKTSKTFADIGKYTAYVVGAIIALALAPMTMGASIAVFVVIVVMIECDTGKGSKGMKNAINKMIYDTFGQLAVADKKRQYMEDGMSAEEAQAMAEKDVKEDTAIAAEVLFWVLVVAACMNPMTCAQILFDGGLMHEFLTDVCGMEEPAASWLVFALELLYLIVELIVVSVVTGGTASAASASKIAIGAQRAASAGSKAAKAAKAAEKASKMARAAQKAKKAARAAARAAGRAKRAGAKKVKKSPGQAVNKIKDLFKWFTKLPKNFWNKILRVFGRGKPRWKSKLPDKLRNIKRIKKGATAAYALSSAYSTASQGALYLLQAGILKRRADIIELRGELEAFIIEMLAIIKVLQTLADDLQSGISDLGNFAIQIGELQEKLKKLWSESIDAITNM